MINTLGKSWLPSFFDAHLADSLARSAFGSASASSLPLGKITVREAGSENPFSAACQA